jgi:hypothetical protein
MLARMSLLLLATLSSLGTQTPPRTNIAPAPFASEIPTVGLCALLSKPADYHGKEVRVRAQYHIGFEYSYFVDRSCKNYAVETTPFWYGHVVWVEFDESVEVTTKPEIYSDFRRSASICCPDEWRDTEVELSVVGKFSKSNYQGPASDKGYGHSGRYALQLVVSRIEAVSASERR